MMLAYSHSLAYDHQGIRPFTTDHREAAVPVEPAEDRVHVHSKLQTVPSCALATASTVVLGRSWGGQLYSRSEVLLLRTVEVGQAAYMGSEGPPIGLYRKAVVQGLSSLLAEFTVSPHVLKENGP